MRKQWFRYFERATLEQKMQARNFEASDISDQKISNNLWHAGIRK